jgi:DNA-binding MarR family transcriptional regulator
MSSRRTEKSKLIEELVREFRESGNQDSAFDNLAAQRLGVNDTDLHCLNIIENTGGLTAGELAAEAGLTTGAVTGVIDRLERVGFARRVSDPEDRRRVQVEVTPKFYARAGKIWGPMARDWSAELSRQFSAEQLELITAFLRRTNEISGRHLDRLRRMK